MPQEIDLYRVPRRTKISRFQIGTNEVSHPIQLSSIDQ